MNLSVIIPVHNGGDRFRRCLEALAESDRIPDEIIVVDDASTDASSSLAGVSGARVITLKGDPRGPAFARNRGAREAYGEILVFLDADVAVHKDTLARITGYFSDNSEAAAVFGSYDDDPPERSIVSLYKNLQHHYVHQHGSQVSSTFWAGCGAIRRTIFESVGGFSEKYTRPSIEDIELGRRITNTGYRILLCPEIQVTHLKRWTFTGWLKCDIFDRAIPWSRLILSDSHLPDDLNLDWRNRVSALAAWASILFCCLGFFFHWAWIVAGCFTTAVAITNRDLYRFFARKGGFAFATAAAVLHFFYFLYSSAVFAIVVAKGKLFRRT